MNEIIPDLSYEEYAKRPGVSSSLLKLVASESLATVKATLDGRIAKESDALDFGKAFHSLLLEGKTEYVIQPATYPSIKDGEKAWNNNAKYCEKWHEDQVLPVLTATEDRSLRGMVEAIQRHEELVPYLNGQTELSIFTDGPKGNKLKARIDLLPSEETAPVIDFKKSRSANPSKFVKQIFDLKYYLQAAFYLDVLKMGGISRKEFWFVSIEDAEPYNIYIAKLVDMPMSFIALGRKEYREAYSKLRNAIETNKWPSYDSSEAEAFVTSWMQQTIETTA